MLKINALGVDALQKALKEYGENTEEAINDVLHNYAGDRAQEEIRRLIPVSGKHWKGKAPAAKTSQSMRNEHGNLSVTVTTAKKYQYLYFPNDGTNTRRHVGNQQFFEKGGEAATNDIVERCISRLTEI
jgi:HK97 gp10 family phage protein